MQSKKLLIVCFSLCAILLFIGLMPVHGEEEIYNTVVRLHVLANSDTKEDQALKLKVRSTAAKSRPWPVSEERVIQRVSSCAEFSCGRT